MRADRWIWLVLLLALVVRVGTLAVYGLDLTINSDDMGYVRSAVTLLERGALTYHSPDEPTVHIMPGQTVLLAAVFLVFGAGTAGLYAAKALMILLGLAAIYGVYLIGQLVWGRGPGLAAALMTAVAPPAVLTDLLLLTETPFMVSFIYLVYFSLRLARDQQMKDFYLLVLCYVSALMFRSTVALYPLVLALYLLAKRYPFRLMLRQAAIAAAILLAVLGPWWVRNYIHYQAFIPLTAGAGNPMLLGTYQGEGYPEDEPLEELLVRLEQVYPSFDAFTMMQVQEEAARERLQRWWATDKRSFLNSYLNLKPKIMWRNPFYWIELYGINWDRVFWIQWHTLTAARWGFLLALLFLPANRRETLFVAAILIYFTAIYSAYFVMDRYNQPLMPLVYLQIGIGLPAVWRLAGRLRSWVSRRASVTAS